MYNTLKTCRFKAFPSVNSLLILKSEMEEYTYKTIKNPSEGLFKDKGSKFIAFAYPVLSEEEAKTHLNELRKEHHSARHHCWAYKIDGLSRSSDDGEPTNSAGKPILGQIEAFNVTNVAIIVVRYFGGVLLGVGGLMQAYKEAAKDALQHAEIVEKEYMCNFSISFPYEQNSAVMNILKRNKAEIISQDFSEACAFRCRVSREKSQQCISALENICEVNLENE